MFSHPGVAPARGLRSAAKGNLYHMTPARAPQRELEAITEGEWYTSSDDYAHYHYRYRVWLVFHSGESIEPAQPVTARRHHHPQAACGR
jgi:hypothetical protein